MKLYHLPYAICAQKVRVCLYEKGLKWEGIDVTTELRSAWYLALNAGGYVPTLVHGDRVITESRVINEYLDEACDGPALQPGDAFCRSVMRRWTKQIDDTLHLSIFVLSCVANFRDRLLAMPDKARALSIPLEPIKRERTLEILQKGWSSQYIATALKRFVQLMEDMERQLLTTQWLAGAGYSLADIDYGPYIQRLSDLGLEWLWEDRPAIHMWFNCLKRRVSFCEILTNWVPEDALARHRVIATIAGPRFREIADGHFCKEA